VNPTAFYKEVAPTMSPEIVSVLFLLVGAAVGFAARHWLVFTKTDGKDTPVLDALAKLIADAQGNPPAAPDAPPATGHPLLDQLGQLLLRQLLAQGLPAPAAPAPPAAPVTTHMVPVQIQLSPTVGPAQTQGRIGF
jgi:hypothetical protein